MRRVLTSQYKFQEWYDWDILTRVAKLYSGETIPNPPCESVIVSDKVYQKLLKLASRNDQIPSEQILTKKCIAKWLTPQGGTFSQHDLEETVRRYYPSTHDVSLNEDIHKQVCSHMYMWHVKYDMLTKVTFIEDSRELYNCYKADHRSIAGMTYNGDRRPREVRIIALKAMKNTPLRPDPVIAGMRNKDSKLRDIFIDSFANYFREVRVFKPCFDWWVQHPSDMHQSDYQLAKEIVSLNAKSAYMADYRGMDMHIYPKSTHMIFDLFAVCCGLSQAQRAEIYMLLDEMTCTDLIVGKYVYSGYHSWFSGLYPTHDMEGFLSFCIQVYTFETLGYEVIFEPKKLKRNQVYLKICGDDSAAFFGKSLTADELDRIKLHHAEVAAAYGQIVEVEKVDYSEIDCTFCKKTFALRQDVPGFKHYTDSNQVPVHKYPLNKALHALRQPENMPKFTDPRSLTIWTCSIMDLSYGMRDYKSIIISLYQQNRSLFQQVDYKDSTISQECELFLQGDWFWRNYVSFRLSDSPTWNLLHWCVVNNM